MAGSAEKFGPRPVTPAIDVFRLEAGGGQQVSECPILGREGFHLLHEAPEADPDGLAKIVEDDARRYSVELNRAAGGQIGKPLLDLTLEAGPRRASQRPESKIEAEALVLLPDEVERGEAVLSLHQAQTAAQLLEEDGRALGGPKKEDGVDLRNIHALVE